MNICDYIMECVLIDIELWGEAILHPKPHYTHDVVQSLRHNGVPYRPLFWANRPLTPAGRQEYSRATRRLEVDGLVVVVPNRAGRAAFVRPTPAGIWFALKNAGDAPNRADIARALREATWAGPEHVAAVEGAGDDAQ